MAYFCLVRQRHHRLAMHNLELEAFQGWLQRHFSASETTAIPLFSHKNMVVKVDDKRVPLRSQRMEEFYRRVISKGYLDRKRRAKPSAPRAAPSNNAVVPPSGTLTPDGGIICGAALALWLNTSIRAQPIPNSTNFLVKIPFVLIINA